MLSVLSLDPGDSTGWLYRNDFGEIYGGTIKYDLKELHRQILGARPQVIVFENFTLHPGAAKSLTHNELYPCQVIGAIKLSAFLVPVTYLVKLAPSVKRFAGSLDDRWKQMRSVNLEIPTEHTKDAYLLLKYYETFYEPDSRKMQECKLPMYM